MAATLNRIIGKKTVERGAPYAQKPGGFRFVAAAASQRVLDTLDIEFTSRAARLFLGLTFL